MSPDQERVARIRDALREDGLDALLCARPANVLMLGGYWPVIGTAVAIVNRDGEVAVVAPEDEKPAAEESWATELTTFQGGSLDSLEGVVPRVCEQVRKLRIAGRAQAPMRIGFEGGAGYDTSGYASQFLYGGSIRAVAECAFPTAALQDASATLQRLRSVLTRRELEHVRKACAVAQRAFTTLPEQIRAGDREYEVANRLRSRLTSDETEQVRCDGFAYCMSGPNAALAYAAYQQSRARMVCRGDFVLTHCNSYYGGFWTDITRTYCLGLPDGRMRIAIDAVLEAGSAAVAAVRPGIAARDVDAAARHVMERYGFGREFKHPTGHGVGFAAINHDAAPRIHPLSNDRLEEGMVFNIEPAAYTDGAWGMRQCNMVTVTGSGAELLTPFQESSEDLIIV